MDDVHPSQRCTALFGGRLFPLLHDGQWALAMCDFFEGCVNVLNQATFFRADMCKARDSIQLVLLHAFWFNTKARGELEVICSTWVRPLFSKICNSLCIRCVLILIFGGGECMSSSKCCFQDVYLNWKHLRKDTELTWILAPELPVLIWLHQMYML